MGGIVVGVMYAGNLVSAVGHKVEPHLKSVPPDLHPAALHLGAVAVLAVGTWIAGSLIFGRNRQKWFGLSGPSPVDRASGAALAVATSAVVVALLVSGIEELPKQIRTHELVAEQVDQSVGVKWVRKTQVAEWLWDVPEFRDAVGHARTVADRISSKKASATDEIEKLADNLLK
jgi:hypothetical protein